MFTKLMFNILLVLQAVAMYLLHGEIGSVVWWGLVAVFVILYFAGLTYNMGTTGNDDAQVVRFWYQVRSIVFIVNIISVIALYLYIFLK